MWQLYPYEKKRFDLLKRGIHIHDPDLLKNRLMYDMQGIMNKSEVEQIGKRRNLAFFKNVYQF